MDSTTLGIAKSLPYTAANRAIRALNDTVEAKEATIEAKEAAQEAAATASAAYGTDLLADDYSTESGATAREYYIHSGGFYLCNSDATGAWDSSKFTQTDVGEQLVRASVAETKSYLGIS